MSHNIGLCLGSIRLYAFYLSSSRNFCMLCQIKAHVCTRANTDTSLLYFKFWDLRRKFICTIPILLIYWLIVCVQYCHSWGVHFAELFSKFPLFNLFPILILCCLKFTIPCLYSYLRSNLFVSETRICIQFSSVLWATYAQLLRLPWVCDSKCTWRRFVSYIYFMTVSRVTLPRWSSRDRHRMAGDVTT